MRRERTKLKAARPERRPAPAPEAAPDGVVAQSRRGAGNALEAIARSATGPAPSRVPPAVVRALATEQGEPLPQPMLWSQRIGADVRHARLITSIAAAEAAAAIRARAFTVGDRVFFAKGNDASTDGGKLLGHELEHVAQQHGAPAPAAWDQLPFVPESDAREQAARGHDPRMRESAMAIARWADTSPVDAVDYVASLAINSALQQVFGHIQDPAFDIAQSDAIGRGPFGKYLSANEAFLDELKNTWFFYSWDWKTLSPLLVPDSLMDIVNRARALDWDQPDPDKDPVKTNKGPRHASDDETAIEIANVFVRRYFDSMARMFPRIAATIVKKNPVPEGDKYIAYVSIIPAEVVVSHPMDVQVRDRMLAVQGSLTDQFRVAVSNGDVPYGSLEVPQNTAETVVGFVPRDGLWHWVKATPETSTREQVATILFGKPEEAYRLISMKPLWGFHARDVDAFTGECQRGLFDAWAALKDNPTALRPSDDIVSAALGLWLLDKEVDPVAELAGSFGDREAEARFNETSPPTIEDPATTAKGVAKTPEINDEQNVFDDEKAMLGNLDDIDALLPIFDLDPTAVEAARVRFTQRRDDVLAQCVPDVESMYRFAEKQRGMLVRVSLGLGDAATRLKQNGGEVAPPSVRDALKEMASAYLAGLSAIELPEVAEPRLDAADVLTRDIDITLEEASLHERLGELHAEFTESFASDIKDPAVDPYTHSQKLDKDLEQLAEARIAMRADPVGTQKKVLELKPKVDRLGFEIGLSEKLARLNMLWSLIDGEEDIWEGALDTQVGRDFKEANRKLYNRFYLSVYLPYTIANAANNDAGRLKAQSAYSDLLKGPEMKAHADAVRDFLAMVAKHKKWTKLIVSLAIAFVAFGLGQWEYGAVLAGGGTVFEAAVSAGLVTTATSVVLNKVILNQNPTVIGVLTSFIANAGTFFVVGKIALAAKAAGTEAALAEPAAKAIMDVGADVAAAKTAASGIKFTQLAASGGKMLWTLTYQSAIAGAVGMATAEIEKLAEAHRTLTWGEVGDVWVQAVISTVAMHVFSAVTPNDLFQYKTPEQKIAMELAGLQQDQAVLLERAQAIQDAADVTKTPEGQPIPKPDKAGVMDLLERWKAYLEREQAVRERLLEYAEKNPGKFSEAEVVALKNSQPDPTIARQIREAKATLAVEVDGINRYSCASGALDTVIAQHQAVGNEIARIETDPQTGQRTITVKPADGSPEFIVTEKVPPKGQRTAAKVPVGSARGFEAWLDARDQPQASVEGQAEMRELYARDPAAAINLASEKYSYQPELVPESELVVHPDAPGGGKAPNEPFVSPAEHQTAVTLGHGVVAIGTGRFLAAPTELAGMHTTWAKKAGSQATEIHYDAETNTSHFEMEVDGERVRVETQLAPRVETFGDAVRGTNQVVGGRVSEAMGEEILRGLANGQHEMLKATGVSGEPVKPGEKLEFGLGKVDGGYVIVVGEPNAVDWAALPGIEPIGHTHPLYAGNDLLPNFQGNREMSIPELLEPKPDSLLNRDLVFPSAQDFVVMAMRRIVGHKVYTGFVVENGVLRKPIAGETLPGIEFTIGETVVSGTNAKGQRVFESTIEGTAGNETPITKRKIWIVEESVGGSGSLFMTEPEGITPVAAEAEIAGGSKTKGALSPGFRKLAKAYGDEVVHWAMDAGSEAEAAALAKIDPPLRNQLMDLPAADARDLIRDATQARIQRALSVGKGGPISAADLLELHAALGKDDLNARLDAAGSDRVALEKLAESAALARRGIPDPLVITKFPANEFPASDTGWQKWPPPELPSSKPTWKEPGGARYRYDRYRYEKWVESGKADKPPKGLIEDPAEYYDRYVAPKARGQSPGEMGSDEHKELVLAVRDKNKIGTQTMGEKRPDAVGAVDQAVSIPDGPILIPKTGERVLYEADNFFKNGTQIVSEGREQVRQFRADNPKATIVVQDVANPKNIIVYEEGFEPPPPGILKPDTPNIVPVAKSDP